MNLRVLLPAFLLLAGFQLQSSASGALVLTVNGQESPLFTFSDATPTFEFTVAVRETESTSGGIFLDSFGFILEMDTPAIAKFTAVELSTPAGGLSSTLNGFSDDRAEVRGTFNTRPNHNSAAVALATFTVTGLQTGTTGIRILERTIGNDDFQNFDGSNLVAQDSTVFTVDNGTGNLRGATNLINASGSITAVPEPSSAVLVLLCGTLGFRRRRAA